MKGLEQQLEFAIQVTLEARNYSEAAELVKALSALRNTANIEKTLKVFAILGESFKKALQGINPETLAQLQNIKEA